MSQNETANLQTILAEIFAFSSEDIAANRMGKLSAAQRERMAAKHYANSRSAWMAFAIIFGLGLLGFSAEMMRTGNLGVQSLLTYLGLAALFGLIVWGFIFYYRRQLKRTLREGAVHSVRGEIQIVMERGEKLMHWYFCVGNQRFEIDRADHRILLQQCGVAGRESIVYFSAPWHGLLSVVLQG